MVTYYHVFVVISTFMCTFMCTLYGLFRLLSGNAFGGTVPASLSVLTKLTRLCAAALAATRALSDLPMPLCVCARVRAYTHGGA
jgi:hypothetical protein